MERTESTVVQVAPSYENEKISEMQIFGWSLHGRQEMRERGDAYGRPSLIDRRTYVTRTKVTQYVKLHFVRSLALPNLHKIKELQAHYESLPFPAPTMSLRSFAPLAFGCLIMLASLSSGDFKGMAGGLVFIVPGYLWIRFKKSKVKEADAVCNVSAEKQEELKRAVEGLMM